MHASPSSLPGVGARAQPAVASSLMRAFRAEELAGVRLATRARVAALAAAALWVLFLEKPPGLYWYEGVIGVLALLGASHYWLASRHQRAWVDYVFVALDAAVLVFALVFLTARLQSDFPPQMALRTAPVAYFFLLISYVALSYSPRLMLWAGAAGALAWAAGVTWLATRPGAIVSLAGYSTMGSLSGLHLDPHYVDLRMRAEEFAILIVSAALLAFVVRRSRQLVTRQTQAARERANLARYFSPRLVEELADRDEPLGPVRRQNVGVLFADIVAFTTMAETMAPEDVMALLRDYHGRMEREVFHHNGTLEKFIGDALLATFGVPDEGAHDAEDAMACARDMQASVGKWNEERAACGRPPIRVGIGLHYGPAVMGDIGTERNMAFAVIGDTVNTASRLQALTRELACHIVASEAVMEALRREGASARAGEPLVDGGWRHLRGREEPMRVWLVQHHVDAERAAPMPDALAPGLLATPAALA